MQDLAAWFAIRKLLQTHKMKPIFTQGSLVVGLCLFIIGILSVVVYRYVLVWYDGDDVVDSIFTFRSLGERNFWIIPIASALLRILYTAATTSTWQEKHKTMLREEIMLNTYNVDGVDAIFVKKSRN